MLDINDSTCSPLLAMMRQTIALAYGFKDGLHCDLCKLRQAGTLTHATPAVQKSCHVYTNRTGSAE